MKSLTIERLQTLLLRIEEDPKRQKKITGDYEPYLAFLKFFENKKEITVHDFYISTGFVYSWMPRMLMKVDPVESRLLALNEVLNGGDLNISQLKGLAAGINNSLVGTSKLLHFICPTRYPIWDSRVYKALNPNSEFNFTGSNKDFEIFLNYTYACREISEDPQFDEVHKRLLKVCKIEPTAISKIRTIELILYANG